MNTLSHIDNSVLSQGDYRFKFQEQPFHLVTGSPWPLLISFSLLNLTVGAVTYFNGYYSPFGHMGLLLIGFIGTCIIIALWFRDVVIEGTFLGDHTSVVQEGLMLGIILFIVSEVFFFLSIFWAYFHSSLSPAVELGTYWPPTGITAINAFELPLVNTMLLLSSGASVTYSHHALMQGDRKGAVLGLVLTVLLALIFTGCQGLEYDSAGFTLTDGVYGSTFYFSTGFHGFHVIIGTIFLFVGLIRLINYHFTSTHFCGFESAILYWHFVDIVWLFLFASVYWWGS